MFGKKTAKIIEPDLQVEVESMPAAFYGGVNPVIKFKTVEKTFVGGGDLSSTEKKALDKTTTVGARSPLHPANLLTRPKFLFLSVGILFLIFGLGGGLYYWFKLQSTPTPIVTAPKNIESIPMPVETIVETATTTEIVTTPTATPVIKIFAADSVPEYPPSTLGESTDADQDDVSDVAEQLFGTNPNIADTDNDTYLDGHEVYYLYNPSGKEPMKIVDSGSIKDFSNPVFQYKLYYPFDWAVGNIDENYRDVLFSTLTGENIEVRTIEKTANQTFADWFGRYAPDEKIGDLKEFFTVFKDKAWTRNDGMVYYFDTPTRVYVMIYHTTDSYVVNYKIILTMMARSFRLPTSGTTIPNPIVESSGPALTSTDIINLNTSTENLNAEL